MRALLLVGSCLLATGALAEMPDPTAPPAQVRQAVSAQVAAPVLQAVLLAGERKLAVIDSQLLQEGESNQRLRVLRINADSVDIVELNSGRRSQLQLPAPTQVKEQRKP